MTVIQSFRPALGRHVRPLEEVSRGQRECGMSTDHCSAEHSCPNEPPFRQRHTAFEMLDRGTSDDRKSTLGHSLSIGDLDILAASSLSGCHFIFHVYSQLTLYDLLQCYRRSLSNDHEEVTTGQCQIARNRNTSQPCSCYQGRRTFLEGTVPDAGDCSRSCGKTARLVLLVYYMPNPNNHRQSDLVLSKK